MLTAPVDISDVLIPKIREMKSRRDARKREVADASQQIKDPGEIEAEVRSIVINARNLAEEFSEADPARRRELFCRFTPKYRLSLEFPARQGCEKADVSGFFH